MQANRLGSSRIYDKRGLTLVELLIAMIITTVVVGAVLGLVISQSRFADTMRTSALQLDQVRSAGHFIGTEINDLTRGSVTSARPDSLAYRFALSWGAVCGDAKRLTKTKTKETEESLVDTASIYLEPLPQALGAPYPDGFGVSTDGLSWRFHAVADWAALGITEDTLAKAACMSNAGNRAAETDMFSIFLKLTDYEDSIPSTGMMMLSYYNVSYFFSSETEGLVLYRAGRDGAQKLAWPFGTSAGFEYRLADGRELTTVADADLPLIRAIRIKLPALQEENRQAAVDTLQIHPWVRLLNSQ